ncbi:MULTISPECIES: ubiquinone/menaquinone biosynthesis methyltransferase [Holospora]|uniref:Ubiquinone/menaquinone biosynthesis C-methyltransferase UbiE n=2 Tax=Holospora TaxID=44747 RepID=A0A061JGI1_9PROT|nr:MULTISPECIES: ubiquinone/menaquinone biosynthesis methyltransferase [Holospora]ETZ05145.1 ubiquinone/menaquinone biosynthesis C-methyltransferase UbiE [Holospora undulata HU1]GAJ46796.1 ubiquinone/menaquinone biosynthesis C-methyltransferase UbiE [Holospora elegans E1]
MNSIASLFDRIAPIYDQMNKIMSLGRDDYWRRFLISYIPWSAYSDFSAIDMACGTGAITDFFLQEAKIQQKSCVCWMIDPSTEMLKRAKVRKYSMMPCTKLHFLKGYAESVPLPSKMTEVYLCGFGVRNMENRFLAFQEAFRLLKPKGILLMLEFSFEVIPILAWAYRRYLLYGIPFLGKWIAKDFSAYQYLSDSILEFPSSGIILKECSQAGFENSQCIPMEGGIVQLYYAQKPNDSLQIQEMGQKTV